MASIWQLVRSLLTNSGIRHPCFLYHQTTNDMIVSVVDEDCLEVVTT